MKNFVIFATDHLGDTLVLGELIYNIRYFYKSVNICLVVYPQWEYVANLMFGIDKIVVLRKNDLHKGLKGIFKLKKEIGYKNIYAAFITFRRQRAIFIANLLNSKYVLFNNINFFFDTMLRHANYNIIDDSNIHISSNTANLLSGILNEKLIHIPIKLDISKVEERKINCNLSDYIAINPIGIGDYKCLDVNKLIDIITFFSKHNEKILILGSGKKAEEYSNILNQSGINCLNLINKTSIEDLVYILTKVKSIVSVDTGTAHLATYLEKKVLWLSAKSQWIPDELYKNSIHLPLDSSPQKIYEQLICSFCQV